MKSFKELMEDVNSIVPANTKPTGIDKGMDAYAKEHMKKYCQQVSSAAQPELPIFLAALEKELNKFAYTLGDVDMEVDLDNDGDEEGLLVYIKATGEMLNNVYLNMDWERLAAPVVVNYRNDGGKLINAIILTLEECSPEELESMISGMENADLEDVDLDHEPNPTDPGSQLHNA